MDKILETNHPRMLKILFSFCNNLGNRIKQWVKPTTVTLAVASLADITRSKADLIAENAMGAQIGNDTVGELFWWCEF